MPPTQAERDVPNAAVGLSPELLPRCPQCDYILHGLTDNRCPECGRAFEPSELVTSRIPWEHRRNLGRLRAYWRTVWGVTRSSHTLTAERGMGVKFADARRFRTVTALWVALPLLAGWAGYAGAEVIPYLGGTGLLEWFLVVAVLPCLYLAIYAAIGVASWFVRTRGIAEERQDTAVALSYYAAAPLAWCPLKLLASVGVARLGVALDGNGHWADLGAIAALCVAALIPAAVWIWWMRIVRLVGCFRGNRASVIAAVAIPALWLVVGLLIGVGLPLSFLWLALAFESLQ